MTRLRALLDEILWPLMCTLVPWCRRQPDLIPEADPLG